MSAAVPAVRLGMFSMPFHHPSRDYATILEEDREAVRAEMARYIEDMRSLQAEGIKRHFQLRGIECPIPPTALTIMIAGIARQIVGKDDLIVVGPGGLSVVNRLLVVVARWGFARGPAHQDHRPVGKLQVPQHAQHRRRKRLIRD